MIEIKNRRECFFDNYLIDEKRTTASALLMHPVRREVSVVFDAAWEKPCANYQHFFFDEEGGEDGRGIYRMYYRASSEKRGSVICYMESTNGADWYRPNLGIEEYDGSYENNIILDGSDFFGYGPDNFTVFKDRCPSCPPSEKYKAVAGININDADGLHYFVSADAINFTYGGRITDKGTFDSLNVAFYDATASKYRCYFRSFHDPETKLDAEWSEENIRDIRYIESTDFRSWSEPRMLDFGASEDVALYTSMLQPCPRAEHIYIGFPSRYLNRKKWSANYDELCGREDRLRIMEEMEPRAGLAITDCVFMASHDGVGFKKYDSAFLRPGPENPHNWVYGDCYPALGLLETPSDVEGAEPELSIFFWERHRSAEPNRLARYTVRREGFVSMHADDVERMLVTKRFTYEGEELFVNFSTSALGYMYFTLVDADGERYESCETFGDSTDRRVAFDAGVVERLSGKPVTLEVRMRDADLYSVRFGSKNK